MDTVLTIIAVLGLGALLISVVIFMLAARRYVSDEEGEQRGRDQDTGREHLPRNRDDRRQKPSPAIFPIAANGQLILEDRRRQPDRRQQSRQFT